MPALNWIGKDAVMNLALRGTDADSVACMVALPGQLFCSMGKKRKRPEANQY